MTLEPVSVDHPDAVLLMHQLNQRLASLSGDSGASRFDAASPSLHQEFPWN